MRDAILGQLNRARGLGDPRELGCRCDECPLGPSDPLRTNYCPGPVFPEIQPLSHNLALAEAPGGVEEEKGVPLVGPSGQKFMAALRHAGAFRQQFNLGNVLLCRPEKNELDRLLLKLQRFNKQQVAAGLPAVPTPMECCKPQLWVMLQLVDNVIALGSKALNAMVWRPMSITDRRGGPMTLFLDDRRAWDPLVHDLPEHHAFHKIRVMPTVHPRFAITSPSWNRPFYADIQKAVRWFSGNLQWRPPQMTFNPTPQQLSEFLKRHSALAWDVETEPINLEPLEDRIRCVGIGTDKEVYSIALLAVDGSHGFYGAQEHEIRAILRDQFFGNKAITKIGWNSRYFDTMNVEREQTLGIPRGGIRPHADGIMLNTLSHLGEMPKALAFVASVRTDAPSWKSDHTALNAQSDKELWTYMCNDVALTYDIVHNKLFPEVVNRGQGPLIEKTHRVQDCCVTMHRIGVGIDHEKRVRLGHQLLKKRAHWKKVCVDIVGKDLLGGEELVEAEEAGEDQDANLDWSPGSYAKVRDLIYGTWMLPPKHFTKMGDPSTKDDALVELIGNPLTEPYQKEFLLALRRYRRATKLFGTYVERLNPHIERDSRGKKKCLLGKDGRLHADWSAHGTNTGRLSSSNINMQNWKKYLRVLAIPAQGHVYVGADKDQLELRIITVLADIQEYLRVFTDGGDPHALTAEAMFGTRFTNAPGSKEESTSEWARIREFSKTIGFASMYWAALETVYEIVKSTEDNTGELINPEVDIMEVRQAHRSWLDRIPELPKWWEAILQEYRAQGHLREPVWGRRCDFLDGEDKNKLVNYKVQSGGSAIVNDEMIALHEDHFPFEYAGPYTGLAIQVHDQIVVEVPEHHAEEAKKIMTDVMTREVPELPGVIFSGGADIGRNFKEV